MGGHTASVRIKPPLNHDGAYKYLFSSTFVVHQFLTRSVDEEFSRDLRVEDIEAVDKSFASDELADVHDLESGTSRAIIVIVTTMAAFFPSVLLAFVLSAWQNIRSDPERMKKLTGK